MKCDYCRKEIIFPFSCSHCGKSFCGEHRQHRHQRFAVETRPETPVLGVISETIKLAEPSSDKETGAVAPVEKTLRACSINIHDRDEGIGSRWRISRTVAIALLAVLILVPSIAAFAAYNYGNVIGRKLGYSLGYEHGFTTGTYSGLGATRALVDFYYAKPEQTFGISALTDYLNQWEWVVPYQMGKFDCSEMSACLERKLENDGWHTYIVVGGDPDNPDDSSLGHAWLLVETSVGEYTPVEATSLRVVSVSDPYYNNYFKYDYQCETILEALEHSPEEADWWESTTDPLLPK